MNIDEFKERLITEGIASVNKNEKRPERIRGGKYGFELCRDLNSIWDFQETIDARHKHETHMISIGAPSNQYWEYRYATIQVEYVYERMLVVWSQMGLYSGLLSARAVIHTANVIGVKEN